MFSEEELAYLKSQPLARLATVSPDGQPTVDAVGFRFDGKQFIIGGHQLAASRKYKNIAAGNPKVSLSIDDLASVQPWTPRGIRIHGTAEIVDREGQFGPGTYLMITPKVSWSWGIAGDTFENGKFAPKKVVWE